MTSPTEIEQNNYNFVYSIIASCENKFHFDCAFTLIELYGKKFPHLPSMKNCLNDLFSDLYLEKFPPVKEEKKIA